MNAMKLPFAASMLAVSLSVPTVAQEATEFRLPEQCAVESAMGQMDHGAMHGGGMESGMMAMEDMDMGGVTEFQRENMEKMMVTMPAMMEGMMHGDPDVAFAYAMIAHHQGAIDMARIQLEHGEDEWIRSNRRHDAVGRRQRQVSHRSRVGTCRAAQQHRWSD